MRSRECTQLRDSSVDLRADLDLVPRLPHIVATGEWHLAITDQSFVPSVADEDDFSAKEFLHAKIAYMIPLAKHFDHWKYVLRAKDEIAYQYAYVHQLSKYFVVWQCVWRSK